MALLDVFHHFLRQSVQLTTYVAGTDEQQVQRIPITVCIRSVRVIKHLSEFLHFDVAESLALIRMAELVDLSEQGAQCHTAPLFLHFFLRLFLGLFGLDRLLLTNALHVLGNIQAAVYLDQST